jgi:hypothetical protein
VFVYNRFGAFNPAGMVYALRRDVVAIEPDTQPGPGNAQLRPGKRPRPLVLRVNEGECLSVRFTNWLAPDRRDDNGPSTRAASFHVNGLTYRDIASDGANVGNNPSSVVPPGETIVQTFDAEREGSYFAFSMGASFGGEGDGGSLSLGLFGAVHVEPPGSKHYRSQTTAEELAAAQKRDTAGEKVWNPDGTPQLDYDARDERGEPILAMRSGGEIIRSDINAIIVEAPKVPGVPSAWGTTHFREFSVFFHDELKVVQAFEELETPALLSVRDAFGVNYGAAGMGAMVLANRKKIGPTKDCVECKLEEFFLSSWAGGDPALNVTRGADGAAEGALWPDDPANVHHSYLGDPVRFRNIHAGPKETHVFHLHAHQWLQNSKSDKSTYLDSQTIGPGSSFSYDINYGGSGNRNATPGDAIYHCHLYPHFAQGMWALWRVHDTFEAGTNDRNLPDGEIAGGVPTPAVVPIPVLALPPMPTYAPTPIVLGGRTEVRPAMPGFPFYVAALPGHRPPQPPLDLEHDGGLPRHVIAAGEAEYLRRGLFDAELTRAKIKLLPNDGTAIEKAAMQFHAGQFPGAVPMTSAYGWRGAGYPSFTALGQAATFFTNGRPPKPGAPLADPCPSDARERVYRAAVVQLDLPVNKYGWHDPQARILVLDRDYDATLARTRPPEPLFFRANSGECIEFHHTNTTPDALEADDFQLFTPTDTIGQHIHLVKFDVTASDGSANGWNYEDGTFAPHDVEARIAAANAEGGAFVADGALDASGAQLRLEAKRHPALASAPLGTQTTIQRWYADPLVSQTGSDRTLRTVFTHDHFGASSHQQHGLYAALIVEPAGSRWRDPQTGTFFGTRDDGGPTSYRADILTANPADSFREFNLAIADFALVYDAQGKPVNPPNVKAAPLPIAVTHGDVPSPEAIANSDPGTMLFNYRNEPIPLRIASRTNGRWAQKAGAAGDMANVFRSDIHGDPGTPLLRAYAGDRVQIRLIQGAQEEQHAFTMHGAKWLHDASDPDSGYTNQQPIGISEHMEFVLEDGMPAQTGGQVADFMYQSAPAGDLWNGTWGIFRSYRKKQADLAELPSNAPGPEVPNHGCEGAGGKPRQYRVHAIAAKGNLPGNRLVYNERFDIYDPDAILLVDADDLPAVRAGTRRPEPLILRARAGECVQITLVNDLPTSLTPSPQWTTMPPIVDGFNVNQVRPSTQIGLHPQLVQYDVNASDGANVGVNKVSTIGPGQTAVYRWFMGTIERGRGKPVVTPIEFGAVNLREMGDVIQHGVHGAIGGLIVEPEDATWTVDPGTRAQATVTYKNGTQTFREFVMFVQDGLGLHTGTPWLRDSTMNSGTALRNSGEEDDAEDSGQRAINYRTEPLWARLGLPPQEADDVHDRNDLHNVLSSRVHGDPATPIFRAKAGQAVRIRVLQPAGHARQHAFTFHGAAWPTLAYAQGSNSGWLGWTPSTSITATQGGMTVMGAHTFVPIGGAGGKNRVTGDFLYRDMASVQFPGGLWGLIRVTP